MRIKHIVLFGVCLLVTSCMFAEEKLGILRLISTSKAGVGYGVYVDDGHAYITNNGGGEALGVCGVGEYLYTADNFGIEVLDVRDPTCPHKIGEYGNMRGFMTFISMGVTSML